MTRAGTALLLALSVTPAAAQSARLTDLSLDELANIQVTSVSRYAEPLSRAPAAIFVITADDIRRSGVTTLPEALRLAPNLQVARVDTGQYAITARGFNGVVANKLLVLVDGRTIYTPLFSGVFWDQQDLMLEDVERIEVISGPRAALWGSNAVNGVINITTRPARETQGTLVSVGGGNREQVAAFRHGAALGDAGHLRMYAKGTHVARTHRGDGLPVLNEREWVQAGFRADWDRDNGTITVQGDAYRVQSEDRGTVAGFALGRGVLTGQNLLVRWTRGAADRSQLRVQAYVDHSRRRERVLFQPDSTLGDVEFQHALAIGNHRLVWGGGYRYGRDDVDDGLLVGFRPTGRTQSWANAYAQDTIALGSRVDVALGMKLERNSFTGWEHQPSARAAWRPSDAQLVWGAVSRSVRAPARFDRDVIQPLAGVVLGGQDFVSEVANVFQAGYRAQPISTITVSLTVYRHDWDRLRSTRAVPLGLENRMEGPVDGVEAWGSWQVLPWWRMSSGTALLRKRLRLEPGSTDPLGPRNSLVASDPSHQWMARSALTIRARHDVDASVRGVGPLVNPVVPAYTAVDARYGWRLRPNLELSVTARNLFDPSHPEFGALPGRSEFERGVFIKATWLR